MVSEPVQATVKALLNFYDAAYNMLTDQSKKLRQFDLGVYNPLTVSPQKPIRDTGTISILEFFKHHKVGLSILSVGVGLSSIWIYDRTQTKRSKSLSLKRRVPKLANGARQDVVLVIGSPVEPLTRLLALDFERRGFIVYLTILDEKDFVYTESNPITDGINYLNLTEHLSVEGQLQKFERLLGLDVVPFTGASSHKLKLVGVVFAPCLYFPIGPLENFPMASWSKLLKKLSVYLNLFSSGLVTLIRNQHSKTILITPSITSRLNLPYHGPEAMFQNSLQSLFTTLTREISQHNLVITQIRLGNISVLRNSSATLKASGKITSEIKGWDEDIKSLYEDDFKRAQYKATPITSTGKSTSLRELYHLIFDVIYSNAACNPVIYCGTGARSYDFLTAILPYRFILWILS